MGTTSEGHSTSSRVMIPATVPSTKLHAQVPTASGLTAFAHYSCCASIVGLGLTIEIQTYLSRYKYPKDCRQDEGDALTPCLLGCACFVNLGRTYIFQCRRKSKRASKVVRLSVNVRCWSALALTFNQRVRS